MAYPTSAADPSEDALRSYPRTGLGGVTVGTSPLRARYERANELEFGLARLEEELQASVPGLLIARREASDASAALEVTAGGLPAVKRECRLRRVLLAEVEHSLVEELEGRQRRERDNQGLHRTLTELQRRFSHALERARREAAATAEAKSASDAAHIETDCLKRTICGLEEGRQLLVDRVARERDKRLRLKAAARMKLSELEATGASICIELKEKEAQLAEAQSLVDQQQAQTEIALKELARCRDMANHAAAAAAQREEAAKDMHGELLHMQRAHAVLQKDFDETMLELNEKLHRESKAQRQWRLQHMEALDARLKTRKQLDQDVIVAQCQKVA
mmetsp:Transcript_14958/g.32883  ORF Transcript_14958/g.32883 Transcript_14958/m.32883 type:complete len:335 (+) Transcript_14958:90-1094(+)